MTMRIRSLLLPAAVAASFAASPALLAQDKSSQLHQAMSKSMQDMKSMQMTGDIDRDFASLRQLAGNRIIHDPEIDQMTRTITNVIAPCTDAFAPFFIRPFWRQFDV